MVPDFGSVRSAWSVGRSAGRQGMGPADVCGRRSSSCCYTASKASRAGSGTGPDCIFRWTPSLTFAILPAMTETVVVQGRRLELPELGRIRELVATNPQWSRRRISEALCAEWDWRNGSGRLKDMATRTLLVKLEARGLIKLPARRRPASNRMRSQRIPRLRWDESPVAAALGD